MGGEEKLERHHHQGKINARDRIESLVDKETFTEIGKLVDCLLYTSPSPRDS